MRAPDRPVETEPIGAKAFAELRATFRGALLRPGEEGYDEGRRVWNGAIDRRPALIARCAGADDVARAVRFARGHDLLVSVRGGGHAVEVLGDGRRGRVLEGLQRGLAALAPPGSGCCGAGDRGEPATPDGEVHGSSHICVRVVYRFTGPLATNHLRDPAGARQRSPRGIGSALAPAFRRATVTLLRIPPQQKAAWPSARRPGCEPLR